MRVLHLIDSGVRCDPRGAVPSWLPADLEVQACAALMRHAPVWQRAVLLGPAGAARRAAGLGLVADATICAPLGVPRLAWRVLRRMKIAHEADVIHCWSAGATGLVRMALGREPTVIGAGGLPPPVELPREVSGDAAREASREALGVGADSLVLALLGRGADADAVRFARVVGALEYAGLDIVGVVPAWAQHLARGRGFARRFGTRIRLVVSDRPAREVLQLADLALWDRHGPAGDELPALWSIAEAHAAGVPVVSAQVDDVAGVYPEAALDWCLAFNSALPELARVLLQLAEDRALRARLSALVREHIGGISGPQRCADAAVRLWGADAGRDRRLDTVEDLRKSVA
jgi:hypothetical protein